MYNLIGPCRPRVLQRGSVKQLLNMQEIPCRSRWVIAGELAPPHEVMPTTDTLYSALGTKPSSVTLVLDVYTVVRSLLPLASWYLTL